MTHRIQIDYQTDDGLQTLYAEMDTDTHEGVLATQEVGEDAYVSVHARVPATGPLLPRVLRGDRIRRVEPI